MHNLNFITFYLQFILILAQSAKCGSLLVTWVQKMVSFLFSSQKSLEVWKVLKSYFGSFI